MNVMSETMRIKNQSLKIVDKEMIGQNEKIQYKHN